MLMPKLVEMIQLEAIRRLRHGSGFKDAEIDSLKIFPLLRESSRSGLIWYSSQRYELISFPLVDIYLILLVTFSGGQDRKYQT